MRTHLILRVTNFAAVSSVDSLRWGLLVCRLTDIGSNDPTKPTPFTTTLEWAGLGPLWTLHSGAAADISREWVLDVKARRKVGAFGETYGLALANAAGTARSVDIYCRTLIARAP